MLGHLLQSFCALPLLQVLLLAHDRNSFCVLRMMLWGLCLDQALGDSRVVRKDLALKRASERESWNQLFNSTWDFDPKTSHTVERVGL
jgi:hypothetical protein